jgi:2-keto-4-pentenoate hydratase/2-oxohepta-3-ene-1,7-dioic acid hydratase in catechol pathway
VIIIGKEGHRIAAEDAHEHIAGLTIMNEGTLRDWVRHAKFNVTQGKNFIHSGSIGPWMVTADEFTPEQFKNIRVTTGVNGPRFEQPRYLVPSDIVEIDVEGVATLVNGVRNEDL